MRRAGGAATGWRRRDVLNSFGALAMAPFAVAAFDTTAAVGSLRAFVGGIDAYRQLRPLRTALADAEAVAAQLGAIGYGVTLSTDTDRAALEAAFARFAETLDEESAAVVYFAGHGLQIAGTNFLLPADCDLSSEDSFVATSLRLDGLLEAVAARRPRQCISMIDACRDAPVGMALPTGSRGLASVNAPGGFYIVYSAGSGQTALDRLDDRDPVRNSVFTRCLLNHLDATTSVDSIYRQTRNDVARLAASVGHHQNPSRYDQSIGELRFDGRPVDGHAAAIPATLGRIENAVALVVAVDHFAETHFPGTLNDAANMELALQELGVDVTTFINPRISDLRQTIERMAQLDKDFLFYFAGPGGMVDNAPQLLVGANGRLDDRRIDMGNALSVESLRSRFERRDRNALFMLDTGLMTLPDLAPGGTGVAAGLTTSVTGATKVDAARNKGFAVIGGGAAILYACNYFQAAADQQSGAMNSPFQIALANTLARPGLALGDFAARVRQDVEDMMRGEQTPLLEASADLRNWVIVRS